MEEIIEILKELPIDLQKEVYDFAQFLLERRRNKIPVFLKQDWAGGLEEFKTQYTSLELQKKVLEWRGD